MAKIKTNKLYIGDCLDILKTLPDNSVDLIFCSPPYENCRLYSELKFNLKGQVWVDWAFERYIECVRVSKGLVAWVVDGKTENFQWSASPFLLATDLHRAGVKLRRPAIYYRYGVCGSGGPDWLRGDSEFIICSSKGRLPWSDNKVCGSAPKYKPGGPMSNRRKNGKREKQPYIPPKKANPGTVIKCKVGGGNMGSKICHKNEAPFSEDLAEFFIKSFCPPNGVVLDPYVGSGTSIAVAQRLGREWIGIDARQSQINICKERLLELGYSYE